MHPQEDQEPPWPLWISDAVSLLTGYVMIPDFSLDSPIGVNRKLRVIKVRADLSSEQVLAATLAMLVRLYTGKTLTPSHPIVADIIPFPIPRGSDGDSLPQ